MSNEDCPILAQSMLGQAEEWKYWNGKPLCTDWELRTTQPQTETIRKPVSIGIHANGGISVDYVEEEVSVETQPEIPPEKFLRYPDIEAEYKSAISSHKDCRYWIAGKHPIGKKPGEYWYYIERDGKTAKSDVPYGTVTIAGRFAREAIDKLTALQEIF